MSADPSCTLNASDFVCESVGQDFSIGTGCDSLISTSPCSSVQSFNVFFDG
jgi:hypothetical protein